MNKPTPEVLQTLDRGLRILQILGEEPGTQMSVADLASRLGVGRTVAYRLVATLAERGFVMRTPSGAFRLGGEVFRLQTSLRPVLLEQVQPTLEALANRVRATAHLTMAEGHEAVAVAVAVPQRGTMFVSYRVGSRHPLDRGAAGRAILAGRLGDSEPVRSRGELQRGASGVAAPILGLKSVELSIGVISLEEMDDPVWADAVREASVAAARALLG